MSAGLGRQRHSVELAWAAALAFVAAGFVRSIVVRHSVAEGGRDRLVGPALAC